MSTKVWMAVAAVVVGAVALSLIALPGGQEWTTDSPEALAEFNAAVDAQMKLYHDEARAHLERALELDPNFVIAKLFLADSIRMDDEERALTLWNDVLSADRDRLSERERVLIERARAYQEKRYDDANRMIDAYLADHPNDPFVLHRKALTIWAAGDYEEAERLNRRLIEIAPNWVIAYNQLGYLAMSQGRFVEAEEYFTSYRFVAPDQANPHDSLGELYIILGRYDEAETSLERSIEIKPDFWAAYDHMVLARLMMHDDAGARQVLVRADAAGEVPEYWATGIDCIITLFELDRAGRSREILELGEERPGCLKGHSEGFAAVTTHRAAAMLGDWDTALAIEQRFEAKLDSEEENGKGKMERPDVIGTLAHMRGVRAALEGDLDGAVESFERADDHLSYYQAANGLFKLYNRLMLVETLLASGKDAKAHKLLAQVRSVNPSFVERFEEQGLRILGLER